MLKEYNKKIILESGEEFYGFSFGHDGVKVAEIVFNTSMVGYQEIISDLSYTYQAVVMTYPLIGNYGICAEDYESQNPSISALIVSEYNDKPSNFRSINTLDEVMKKFQIVGISGIDTRKLTRSIRDKGSRKVLITDIATSLEEGVAFLKDTVIPTDAVSKVSTKQAWSSKIENAKYHVVAIDCGIKLNIVRCLNEYGCNVTVVPYDTSVSEIVAHKPDGIFISNGPGDPQNVPEVIQTVKSLVGKYPIFGICLGHQIISLAYGAQTYKLKFGHRGANHPVKNLKTNLIEITSQNHSYATEVKSLTQTALTLTHTNLLDETAEGVECEKDLVFSVQYHPESAPGPQDSEYLFAQFIKNIHTKMHKEEANG